MATYARFKGAMVWSPMSNLLLYGKTARVGDAKRCGVRIGLGSDWSPTGSKNLLGELKVARLVSGTGFTDAELVDMVTRTAAAILGWAALGSLEGGKRADLVVMKGSRGDPYDALIRAKETEVRLVVIGGVPRFGVPGLFDALGVAVTETLRIGGNLRSFNLAQPTADPVVRAITLADARATLKDALRRLPDLARALENAPHNAVSAMGGGRLTWSLALDEIEETGMEVRPRLRGARGRATGPRIDRSAVSAVEPLSAVLQPLELDPLTVADDGDFLDAVEQQRNLPTSVRAGLRGMY
jgi:hypothetical protein